MHSFLTDIAISIILSSVFAVVVRFLKQPLILGYIAAGIVLGPGMGSGIINDPQNIELISEIGLIFLLFIIGSELKIKDMLERGRDIIILSISQLLVGFGIIFISTYLLKTIELTLTEKLYLSFALNLTSTLIVVKILKDRFEIQTLASSITIGILIFQDLIATIFLVFQKDFSNPQLYEMLKSVSFTLILLILSFISSKYLFLKLISKHSNSIELTILLTLAYCFAISSVASLIGVSKEMGALIAGFAIGNSPYSEEIVIRISSIRDFFVTLFFVSLGLKLPHIDLNIVSSSLALLGVILLSRIVSIIFFYKILSIGIRPLFIVSLNLFPVSEFSLVISSVGLSYNHISPTTNTLILITMILSSLAATYIINYSHQIYSYLSQLSGIEKLDQSLSHHPKEPDTTLDILILGFTNITAELIKSIKAKRPLANIIVADFNAGNMKHIERLGARWVYVDLANYSSLKRLEGLNPRFVISPMTDMILKGTDVTRLYLNVKSIFTKSKIIFLSETENHETRLKEAGARVINKSKIIAQRFLKEILTQPKKTKEENII